MKEKFQHVFAARLGAVALAALFFTGANVKAQGYKPPVGIPMPSFGVTNSHWMYTNSAYTYNFGAGPVPYPTTDNGPYTHYVDMTAASSTDTANPFGTPAKPRKTFPSALPPGSVVEIHGGPYNFRNVSDKMALSGVGTPDRPIFMRGASPAARPTFNKDLLVLGSWMIMENLEIGNTGFVLQVRADLSTNDMNGLVFRQLLIKGRGTEAANGTALGGFGRWSDPNGPWVRNVLIQSNTISTFGNWQNTVENDWIGVSVGGYNASDIWILDNDISRHGGDSLRVGSNLSSVPYTTRRIYIGRNHLYENRENALDIKGVYDVVVSENKMHTFRTTPSDPGSAVPIHYKCTNIWILNNEFYDAPKGIVCSDAGDVYVIGNVFHDLADGINYWADNEIHVVANTFARITNNCINDTGNMTNQHPLINNIFTGLMNPLGYHIKMNSRATSNSIFANNIIFEPSGLFRTYLGVLITNVTKLQTVKTQVVNTITIDPQFVNAAQNDFRLKFSSPARNSGKAIDSYSALFAQRFPVGGLILFDVETAGQEILRDVRGVKRPQDVGWDIGAYEYARLPAPANVRIVTDP